MIDILAGIAEWAAFAFQKLGASGTLFLILGILLLILGCLLGRAVLRTVLLCLKVWRKLPRWGKQTVGVVSLGFVYFFVWPFIPKTEAVVAVGCGFAIFYWANGYSLSKKYGIDGGWTMIKPILHHAEITQMQRGLTSAIEETTGKKNGRARKPTMTATGFDVTEEPPDGMSAAEFAERINNGEMAPALARKRKWGEVKGMTATAQTDHTVRIHVDRQDMEAGEVLVGEEWFT